MASPAHCFYCFECLDASFERREPPSLQKVNDLYDEFVLKDELKSSAPEPEVAIEDEDVDDGSDQEMQTSHPVQNTTIDRARPQLPSISRLQASTSSSRSSSASSPSTVSAKSSQSQLTK